MSEHIYTRIVASNEYDIDKVARVDGGGNQIYLANEVKTALSGKNFTLRNKDTECKFVFDDTLISGEITTLDRIVLDHKNNI